MAVDPKYAKELQEALDAQPPLSWLDRGIWLAGAVAGFAATGGLWVLMFSRMNGARGVNPDAIAVGETSAIFWGIPGVVFPFLIGLFCLCSLYYKIALFGRRDTVYSGSTHRDLVGYPLLMDLKEAPEPVRRRVWKDRKVWINVGIALAVFLYLFTWSGNSRQVVWPDGSLQLYGVQGHVTKEYAPQELERFTLRISEPHDGVRNSQRYYGLDFMVRYSDGQYYQFRMSDRTGDDLNYLRMLLELKNSIGPDILRIEDQQLLLNLIQDRNWTGEEKALALELFESPEK